jgi:hypothetical protein
MSELFEIAKGLVRAQAQGVSKQSVSNSDTDTDTDTARATDHEIIVKLGYSVMEMRLELERLALDMEPDARTGRIIERADDAIMFAYDHGGSHVFG